MVMLTRLNTYKTYNRHVVHFCEELNSSDDAGFLLPPLWVCRDAENWVESPFKEPRFSDGLKIQMENSLIQNMCLKMVKNETELQTQVLKELDLLSLRLNKLSTQ